MVTYDYIDKPLKFNQLFEKNLHFIPSLINVRVASHQCGPGSIPRLGVICGLSLLVLFSASRGFSPGTSAFPSPHKPKFDLICINLLISI